MLTQIRESLIEFVASDVATAFPGLKVVYDNSPFDWASPPAEFVCFEIQFLDGSQVGVSSTPKTRIVGSVYLTAYAKAQTGSKRALATLDWFADKLEYARVGSVQVNARQPQGNVTASGYYTEKLKLSFYSDPT